MPRRRPVALNPLHDVDRKARPEAQARGESPTSAGGCRFVIASGWPSAGASVADLPIQKTTPNSEIILGEEELSDVSLATFYVFDKERRSPNPGVSRKGAPFSNHM